MFFQVIFYCSIQVVQKWRKQIMGLIQNWDFVRQLGPIYPVRGIQDMNKQQTTDSQLTRDREEIEKQRRLIIGRMRSQKTRSRNELVEQWQWLTNSYITNQTTLKDIRYFLIIYQAEQLLIIPTGVIQQTGEQSHWI